MKISLAVPVYNEEDTILLFYTKVREYEAFANYEVEIVFVNDGSADKTETIINTLACSDPLVVSLNLTRNFGKEAALYAGIEHATGDAVIPIDVDLQDPIEVIPGMIQQWQDGADVVLAKRVDRESDNFLKKTTASLFYKTHNKLSKTKIEENVGDFRLMSKRYVEDILKLPESNLFMKGILSWPGGDARVVEYKREARVAGKTKFNGWKLWNLALEGITSFSTVPLKIWTYIGLFFSMASVIYAFFIIIRTLVFGNPIHGYPSLIASILLFSGIQLIGIGVLGEYIGRIYIEVKRRPKYLLKDKK